MTQIHSDFTAPRPRVIRWFLRWVTPKEDGTLSRCECKERFLTREDAQTVRDRLDGNTIDGVEYRAVRILRETTFPNI